MTSIMLPPVISDFLERTPWKDARAEPLLNEASVRTYFRLAADDGKTAIVMYSTLPQVEVVPFVKVTHLLASLGMNVPQIYHDSASSGLLLLEDFGPDTFLGLFKKGEDPLPYYLLLADTLAELRKNFEATKPDLSDYPNYFGPSQLKQIQLIPDVYVPAFSGHALTDAQKKDYLALWTEALRVTEQIAPTFMLRDCQPANLLYLQGRSGIKACGLIDYEMAGLGPCIYDVMSALRTSRYDVPQHCVEPTLNRYLSHFPNDDKDQILASYAVLGALRALGWAGTCSKLATQDGRTDFASRLPTIWARAEEVLSHPALSALKQWHDEHIPPHARTGVL